MKRSLPVLIALSFPLMALQGVAQYCSSTVNNPCGGNEYIRNVTIGSINNTSACGAGYENYSGIFTAIPPVVGLPIVVNVGSWYTGGGDVVSVFCDWNNDFTLNGPNEVFPLTLGGAGPNAGDRIYTGTIIPPAWAAGQVSRMRVVLQYIATPVPCTAQAFGNIEDYTLNVGPVTGFFQTNHANASFDINGVLATPSTPAIVTATADNECTFGATTVTFASTLAGAPWDLAFYSGVSVPANFGGLQTGGGQFVNVELFNPTFQFLLNDFVFPFPAAPLVLGFGPGTPFGGTAQMVVLDASTTDGFRLSQACEMHTSYAAVEPAGPAGDDNVTTYTIANLCGINASSFAFFGTSYTQLAVTTNGRVEFGGANAQFSPSLAGAMAAPGTLGAWTDFDTGVNPGGHIALSSPAQGMLRVDWVNVGYYGQAAGPANSNNFGIALDFTSGNMGIDGLAGLLPLGASGESVFLGISKGAGATDPGQASVTLGGHIGPGGNGMIYRFSTAATVHTGFTSLAFFAAGANYNYVVN